jgi:hypothetical protein
MRETAEGIGKHNTGGARSSEHRRDWLLRVPDKLLWQPARILSQSFFLRSRGASTRASRAWQSIHRSSTGPVSSAQLPMPYRISSTGNTAFKICTGPRRFPLPTSQHFASVPNQQHVSTLCFDATFFRSETQRQMSRRDSTE